MDVRLRSRRSARQAATRTIDDEPVVLPNWCPDCGGAGYLDSINLIEAAYDGIAATGCRPITLGGDHTIALPILRALHRRHGPLGLVHVDAHADVNDTMFDQKIAHGTPFRRATEEGLIDPHRVVQIVARS